MFKVSVCFCVGGSVLWYMVCLRVLWSISCEFWIFDKFFICIVSFFCIGLGKVCNVVVMGWKFVVLIMMEFSVIIFRLFI